MDLPARRGRGAFEMKIAVLLELFVPQKDLITNVVSSLLPALGQFEEHIGHNVKANIAQISIDKNGGDEILKYNDRVLMNMTTRQAELDGKELPLTPIEFKLLSFLLRHRGQTQSRETLLRAVWNHNPNNTTRTVDTHVRRLRAKLKPGNIIVSIIGIGYVIR